MMRALPRNVGLLVSAWVLVAMPNLPARGENVPARDDIVTAELVVPVGRPILLTLHAKDVSHSFFVPELRLQQDFVPGLVIPIHFTATQVAKTEIVCTQLCGLGHYNMKTYLEVKSQADFDKWLKEQAAQ